MQELRIIIAGSRDFNNYNLLKETVDNIIRQEDMSNITNIVIVSGGARGADRLGEQYANNNGYKVIRFTPDWEHHGKSAGPIRNGQMAEYSMKDGSKGVQIAFWNGESKGTKNMIQNASRKKLKIHLINY